VTLTIVRHPVSNPHRSSVKQLRWDKGDTDSYYYESGLMLSKIQHDWPCEHANKCDYCCNASCQHDLDVFYSEIIHGLREAAKSCIPEIHASALKYYWSPVLEDLKQDSIMAHNMSVAGGRPSSGMLFETKI